MKYFLLIVSFVFVGCGSNSNILLNTGKLPPTFFSITDKKTMDSFVFDTQKFSFMFPTSKQSDFTGVRQGWRGASSRDGHSVSLSFQNGSAYHIVISTDYEVRKYGERERAIDNNDILHLRTRMPKRLRRGVIQNIILKTEHYGKGNYSCLVRESHHPKYNKRKMAISCFKSNPQKTIVRGVGITLTYNKPKNPTLAKQYTYNDLKRRAKRMLDSLYIKDGW